MISHLILDLPYTLVENTYCLDENHIQEYVYFPQAKAACANDSECTMIYDDLCNNNLQRRSSWITCKGEASSSIYGACTYMKGQLHSISDPNYVFTSILKTFYAVFISIFQFLCRPFSAKSRIQPSWYAWTRNIYWNKCFEMSKPMFKHWSMWIFHVSDRRWFMSHSKLFCYVERIARCHIRARNI